MKQRLLQQLPCLLRLKAPGPLLASSLSIPTTTSAACSSSPLAQALFPSLEILARRRKHNCLEYSASVGGCPATWVPLKKVPLSWLPKISEFDASCPTPAKRTRGAKSKNLAVLPNTSSSSSSSNTKICNDISTSHMGSVSNRASDENSQQPESKEALCSSKDGSGREAELRSLSFSSALHVDEDVVHNAGTESQHAPSSPLTVDEKPMDNSAANSPSLELRAQAAAAAAALAMRAQILSATVTMQAAL